MDRFAHYAWPFFEPRHAKLAAEADAWARENLGHAHGDNPDAICKRLVQDLGCAGYLNHAVTDAHDVRSIALATPQGREHFINDPHLGDALRAGLLRAVDDAEQAGAIPGIVADGLRQVIQGLPADQIVEAARNASTLFGDAQDVLGQIENFFNGL